MHEAFHDHLFVPIWIVDLRGRKIEIGDQSLVQKIFRYTDPFPLRSTQYQNLQNYINNVLHTVYIVDILLGQPIKLIHVVSTSEFHEY